MVLSGDWGLEYCEIQPVSQSTMNNFLWELRDALFLGTRVGVER